MVDQRVAEPSSTVDGKKPLDPIALVGALLALLLAAVDSTVIAAILPEIAGSVGAESGSGYAWMVSAFLMAQVASTPIAGWLADRYGAPQVLLVAACGFAASSLWTSAAGDFAGLLGSRIAQGAFAGALVVGSYVVVGELFGPDKRAFAQGLLSMIWGVAAVAGPVVGGSVNGIFGWRWVFVGAAVLSLLSPLLLFSSWRNAAKPRGASDPFPSVEYVLVFAFSMFALIAPQSGDLGLGWGFAVFAAVAALALLAAIRWRGGVLMPRELFARGPVQAALVTTFAACVVMYATVSVLPILLARSGYSGVYIGTVVALSALGWVIASACTGLVAKAFGLTGGAWAGIACLLASSLAASFVLPAWAAGALAGVGTGLVTATMLALIQNSAPPAVLGRATAAATMFRRLGAAIGVNSVAALSATLEGSNHSPERAFWLLVGVSAAAAGVLAAAKPKTVDS
jgi:MFS family permease